MTPRFIEWIWHIKGSLTLAPTQSSDEAFERLDPMFQERGTSCERTGDTLVFRKTNQAPQDKMAIFDRGTLRIERGANGSVLHYHMASRALLFCFLAPLLFLGFAQLTIAVGKLEKSSSEATEKADTDAEDPKDKYAEIPLHPIDQFLGAPAPENPKKDEKSDDKEKDKGPSPTPAYVFAALFAILYAVGRVLEDWLIKARFRKRLQDG